MRSPTGSPRAAHASTRMQPSRLAPTARPTAATCQQPSTISAAASSLSQRVTGWQARLSARSSPAQQSSSMGSRSSMWYSTTKTAAAAPETLVVDDSDAGGQHPPPAVEFLGVLNEMQTVRGVLQTPADPDLVYNILTDYDSCSRVFRNISGSQTLFTDAGDKQVIQACKWQFLAFKGTFNVHLNVMEAPEQRLLVFTLAESSFMRDFEGRWQVEPLPSGGSRIEHVLAVKPLLSIPAAVAPYTGKIFKSQVAALLQDLKGEIDRQAEATAAETC